MEERKKLNEHLEKIGIEDVERYKKRLAGYLSDNTYVRLVLQAIPVKPEEDGATDCVALIKAEFDYNITKELYVTMPTPQDAFDWLNENAKRIAESKNIAEALGL